MDLANLNYVSISVATVSAFALGYIWFSPMLLHKIWMDANNFSADDLTRGKPAVLFGIAFLMTLLIAFIMAIFLNEPSTNAAWGATAGFLAGVWVVAGFVIIALFERRPFNYHWVNGGYLLVAFTLIGLILGAWR